MENIKERYPVGTTVQFEDRDYPSTNFIGTVLSHDEHEDSITIKHPDGAHWCIHKRELERGAYKLTCMENIKAGDYVVISKGIYIDATIGLVVSVVEQQPYRYNDDGEVVEYIDYVVVRAFTDKGEKAEEVSYHPSHLKPGGLATLYPVGTKVSLQDRAYPNNSFIGGTVIAHDSKGFSIDIKHPTITAIWIVYASDILDGSYKLTIYHE